MDARNLLKGLKVITQFSKFSCLFIILIAASCAPEKTPQPNVDPQPSEPTENTTLLDPELAFTIGGPLRNVVGKSTVNKATSKSTGTITYSSADNKIARVTTAGLIQFIKQGKTTVTASVEGDDFYNAANVTIEVMGVLRNANVNFDNSQTQELVVFNSYSNQATTNTDSTIDYSSSDTNVVTIDAEGKVTATGFGSATITASVPRTASHTTSSDTYNLSVIRAVREINITNSSNNNNVETNKTLPLSASFAGQGSPVYTSSNTDIATIDSTTGILNAMVKGTTTITASLPQDDQYEAATSLGYIVKVIAEEGEIEEKITRPFEFKASINRTMTVFETTSELIEQPVGTSPIVYSSSNINVADFNNGFLTAKASGTTTIFATQAEDNQYLASEASFVLTINLASRDISLSNQESINTIGVAQTLQFTSVFLGLDTPTYSSSNNDVATVNSTTGLVTSHAQGVTTITATLAQNYQYEAAISNGYTLNVIEGEARVSRPFRFKPSISQTITVFDTVSDLIEQPVGTHPIIYSSSDTNVADFENGVLTAKSAGSTVIWATQAADNQYLASEAFYVLAVNRATREITIINNSNINSVEALQTLQLAAGFQGEGTPTYISSHNDVATINASTGLLTALKAGTTSLTAMLAQTDQYEAASSAIYAVKVNRASRPFTFKTSVLQTMTVFDQASNLIDQPLGTQPIIYTSSNTSVAAFVNGVLTAKAAGTTFISATQAADDQYLASEASFSLTVNRAAQAISFDHPESKELIVFNTYTNKATTDTGNTINYSSSNESIATVSTQGIVTPNANGSAIITASVGQTSTHNAVSTFYNVSVSRATRTISIINSSGSNTIDATQNLQLSSNFSGQGNPTYTSTNPSVATINTTSGLITAVKQGTTNITVTLAQNNQYEAVSSVPYSIVVERANRPLIFKTPVSQTMTVFDTAVDLLEQPASTGLITFSSSNIAAAEYTNGILTAKGAGTTMITANQVANDQYLASEVTFELTVNRATQVISFYESHEIFDLLTGMTLSNQAFALGNPAPIIEYSSSHNSIATPDSQGNIKTQLGSNTVTITASTAQTSQYESGQASYTIILADLTLSAEPSMKTLSYFWRKPPFPIDINIYDDSFSNSINYVIAHHEAFPTDRRAEVEVNLHLDNISHIYFEACIPNTRRCLFEEFHLYTEEALKKFVGYLKAVTIGEEESFGTDVAVSGDGLTMAVLNKGDGEVTIYTSTDNKWVLDGFANAARYGSTIALSDNGQTLAIGDPEDSNRNSGSVDIYRRVSSDLTNNWDRIDIVTAPERITNELFGTSMALSADGSILAVGAIGNNSQSHIDTDDHSNLTESSGAVYIFEYSPQFNSWEHTHFVKPDDINGGDNFGQVVSMNHDGTILAVGAPGHLPSNAINITYGAAYAFHKTANTWVQNSYLTLNNSIGAIPDSSNTFGPSLELSLDGFRLVVGSQGGPYWVVYEFDGKAYTPFANNSRIGSGSSRVSLSGDGEILAVTDSGNFIEVFNMHSGIVSGATSYSNDYDDFGAASDLSFDGRTLIVGAPLEDSADHNDQDNNDSKGSGAVYTF